MSRYESMPYVRCGVSGLRLPRLSLGGWHNFDDFERARILCLHAFDHGVTHFDLANNYGPPPGIAETHMGFLLKGDLAAHRDELILSTKAGYFMWDGPCGEFGSRKHVLASLDQSLRRLQVEYVDIFYSHRFDPETPLDETMGALHTAVVSGKALYAGISNYPAPAVKKAAKIMRKLGTPLIIHQCSYSMLNRAIEKKILETTADREMGMIVFCPLAQGLLTDRYLDGVPADSRAAGRSPFLAEKSLNPELVAKLKGLAGFANKRGQSLSRFALQWCLRDKRVTSLLIGASRTGQIDENLKALSDPMPTAAEFVEAEAILNPPAKPTPAPAKALPEKKPASGPGPTKGQPVRPPAPRGSKPLAQRAIIPKPGPQGRVLK